MSPSHRVGRTWIGPREILGLFLAVNAALSTAFAAGPAPGGDSTAELARYAMKLPTSGLVKIEPPKTPNFRLNKTNGTLFRRYSIGRAFVDNNLSDAVPGQYPWRIFIATTIFWVGEQSAVNAAISNEKSAWDGNWFSNYGGYDDPGLEGRRNFVPVDFLPRQNPFYVALPYNDVDDHHTKPEAAQVIPWFRNAFVRDGQSVCKGRWIEIRHKGRVCYAQWEDVGPFQTDDLEYVFGGQRPRPNRNGDAGLDVSPAVRDYLGLGGIDFCDWRFVDFSNVPRGPWAVYGDNNTFLRYRPKGVAAVKRSAEPF
jgi:hypothetical protein